MARLRSKPVNGIDYWYLVESRRVNGKPREITIEYFGNTKKFSQYLLNSQNENKILKSYSHGDTYALLKIAKKLNIEGVLDNIFSRQSRDNLKRSQSLLLIALQRVCKPSSKKTFANWFETTSLPYELDIEPKKLTSQHFWDQMDEITESELAAAEDAIIKVVFEKYEFQIEKIALDYTNYFSYIDSNNDRCTLAKRGHNKQKRHDLKQFSLALITTKDIGLPICSHIYEGNVNDQSEFLTYFNILKKRIPNYDPKTMTLVFDGGSNNKENLNTIDTYYICGFSLSTCKELYEIKLSDYTEIKIRDDCIVKAYRIKRVIWDKERDCILTYSRDLYRGQLKELNTDIAKAKELLTELNEKLANEKSRISKLPENIEKRIKKILSKSHLSVIFNTNVIVADLNRKKIAKKVEYSINDEEKSNVIYKYFGKKLMITNRVEWETQEIIRTYREQDCIEKIFKDLKNTKHFSIRPQYHFTDQKMRVHIFCTLLGLTLATVLYKEVLNYGYCELSKIQLIDTLSQIRRCWIRDKDKDSSKVTYVLEEMTNLQSKLWEIINVI